MLVNGRLESESKVDNILKMEHKKMGKIRGEGVESEERKKRNVERRSLKELLVVTEKCGRS